MGIRNKRAGAPVHWGTVGVGALALLVSACGSQTPKVALKETGSKEYFAESEYGVKASPRVAMGKSGLKRGGGRYHVGKPYSVKGKWYRPKEEPNYVTQGAASWYGSAFHGRLTANGEVYDMTHLTAAHPTMPLPSYARVTNLNNGSSIVVRVNDRGPFAEGRVIDLSKRAAEMLDYTHSGVAKVRVEYVGPAPLHGQDESYLMASYRPGDRAPDPSDGLPSGVMIAMNGPTPSQPVPEMVTAFASQPAPATTARGIELPAVGPIVPDRPHAAPALPATQSLALLSYADQRVQAASQAFDAILRPELDGEALAAWWARKQEDRPQEAAVVNLGTWASRREAESVIDALSTHGQIRIEEAEMQGDTFYALSLVPGGDADLNEVLRAAWAAGAVDAFTVRD
ncbi:septal ring lytic transglycosylase RlpA family protein [Chelativorans salis]|uniref:Endolytic peptidoglycan transglycosylase RlpA n=1 Tax=Chelativorans salis TaxID=2978478 RepID=A0ABT2LLJ4_9HYPH|nr:septal ring lytic transglycosylase RlpA family protein [Chelativorans sp. EGI FJ00035]MCT7375398.1 septal ring lytic transglycosylase RlpA family protein [Chelativorans sp. EGI FJ00035]